MTGAHGRAAIGPISAAVHADFTDFLPVFTSFFELSLLCSG